MASASRISSSNTGAFDQVTALSQYMINQQFQTLFDAQTELSTFTADPVEINGSTITPTDIVLDYPKVTIPVDNSAGNIVQFSLKFQSGTLVYVQPAGGSKRNPTPGETDTYDVTGWVFTFNINMGLKDVDKTKLDDLKKELNVAGDYSIQRLYLDFTTSDIVNFLQSESSFGKYDFSKFPANMKNVWNVMIQTWVNNIDDDIVNICYHGTAPDSTVVTFQTLKFAYPNNGDVPAQDQELNALLWLETCVQPGPVDTHYAWAGNLLSNGDDGKSRVNGTMVISRKLFFEKFLLPILQPVNQRSQITPVSAKNNIDGLYLEFSWNFHTGWDSAHTDSNDTYYNFTHADKTTNYTWTVTKPQAKDNAGSTGILESTLKVSGDTTNVLTWTPGGNSLLFTVKSHYRVDMWNEQWWIENTDYTEVFVGFDMRLEFQSVSKGVLQINTYFPIRGGNQDNQDFKSAVWTTGGTHATSIFEKNPEDKQEEIKGLFVGSLSDNSWLTERLEKVLSEHRFVFPGNGTFSFLNPVFNQDGDLLVEVNYDGLTQPPVTGNVGVAPSIPVQQEPALQSDSPSVKKTDKK